MADADPRQHLMRGSRKSVQRIIRLALHVLYVGAFRWGHNKVITIEVRLALAVLWCILRDKSSLALYAERGAAKRPHIWDSLHDEVYRIKWHLRDEGWDAPIDDPDVE